MTMQPYGPDRDPAQDATQSVVPLAHPTEEVPTYRKVAGYPDAGAAPNPTRPITGPPTAPTPATGQLPVSGAPLTTPPPVIRPRGAHLPTVVRGVVILAMAAIVVVWRLVDHPNWPVVGISVGIGAGVLFLLLAAASAVLHHGRNERDFDSMLPGP